MTAVEGPATHSSVVQTASNPRTDPGAQEAQPPCPVSTRPVPEEASASAAQPKKLEQLDKQNTSKASSAAQPASNTSMDPDIEATNPPWPMYMTAVEGPASSTAALPEEVEQPHQSELSEALSLVIPTSSTPLYSALLEKLANTDDQSTMDSLASICLFGELRNKPPAVSAAQPDHDPISPFMI